MYLVYLYFLLAMVAWFVVIKLTVVFVVPHAEQKEVFSICWICVGAGVLGGIVFLMMGDHERVLTSASIVFGSLLYILVELIMRKLRRAQPADKNSQLGPDDVPCHKCGAPMVREQGLYKCLHCGASSDQW